MGKERVSKDLAPEEYLQIIAEVMLAKRGGMSARSKNEDFSNNLNSPEM